MDADPQWIVHTVIKLKEDSHRSSWINVLGSMLFTGVQLYVQISKAYEDRIKQHDYCCLLGMTCMFFSLCKLSFNSFIKNVYCYGSVLASVWLTHAPSSFRGCTSSGFLPSTCLRQHLPRLLHFFSSSSGCHFFLKDIWAEALCAPLTGWIFGGRWAAPTGFRGSSNCLAQDGSWPCPTQFFPSTLATSPCPLCPVRGTIPAQYA